MGLGHDKAMTEYLIENDAQLLAEHFYVPPDGWMVSAAEQIVELFQNPAKMAELMADSAEATHQVAAILQREYHRNPVDQP